MLRRLTGALAILVLMPSVFAHEGHGHPEHQQGIVHYVVNPSHLLPIAFGCAAMLTAAWAMRRMFRPRTGDNQSHRSA